MFYQLSDSEPSPYVDGQPVYNVTTERLSFRHAGSPELTTLWAWADLEGVAVSVTPLLQTGAPSGVYSGQRAITQQGYIEANIKNGVQYYFRKAYPLTDAGRGLAPIGSGESRYLLFTTTTKKVLFKTRVVSYIGEEFAIEIFANPTLSDNGTQIAASNYNGVNPVPTTVEVYKDVVPSDEGAPLDAEPEYYLGHLLKVSARPTRYRKGESECFQRMQHT